MTKHIAVSVLGKDRPGIVAAVSKVLFETGCNIEDSSMTLLRSEFAMIVLVALPDDDAAALEKKLKAAGKKLGLSILLRPITEKEDSREKRKGVPHVLAVYGADKPGIVYTVSSFLSEKKINITDVQTNVSRGINGTVYVMLLETDIPFTVDVETLKKELGFMAHNLQVTVDLHAAESPEL